MSGCSAPSVLPLGHTRIWVPAPRDSPAALGVIVPRVLQLKQSWAAWKVLEGKGWLLCAGEHPWAATSRVLHPDPGVWILFWTLEGTALLWAPPCTPEHPNITLPHCAHPYTPHTDPIVPPLSPPAAPVSPPRGRREPPHPARVPAPPLPMAAAGGGAGPRGGHWGARAAAALLWQRRFCVFQTFSFSFLLLFIFFFPTSHHVFSRSLSPLSLRRLLSLAAPAR